MSLLDEIEKGKVVRLKDLNKVTRDELRELDAKEQALYDRIKGLEIMVGAINDKLDMLKQVERKAMSVESTVSSLQLSSDALKAAVSEEARKAAERRLSDENLKRRVVEITSEKFDTIKRTMSANVEKMLIELSMESSVEVDEIKVKLWAALTACVFILENTDSSQDKKVQHDILLKNIREITSVLEDHTENDEQFNALREGKWKEYYALSDPEHDKN